MGCHGCIISRDPSNQNDARSETSDDGVPMSRIRSAQDSGPDLDSDGDDLSGVRAAGSASFGVELDPRLL